MAQPHSITSVANKATFIERPEISTFEDVEREFLRHHPQGDASFLRKVYEFAKKAHEPQKRKSGEPYIIHPLAVAHILAECKLDVDTVAAAFLHDVVEDCDVEVAQIQALFGPDVARIVDGVSKIGKVRFRDKVEAQAENYRKMILAISEDIRVLLVKLADRWHNMLTLHHLPQEKRRRIAQETLDIFAPLAHRIGMSNIKAELERLSFMNLEPEAYADLDQCLKDREAQNQEFIQHTTLKLTQLLKKYQIEAEVSSRVKSHYSIWRKLQKKRVSRGEGKGYGTDLEGNPLEKRPIELDEIYDFYAFRILTHSVEGCYMALGMLHGNWKHIPGRIKDFIATPKSNLYQSLHTTLVANNGSRFEVQIRTEMMHRIAEEGVAAHWTYKNGKLLSLGKTDFVSWFKRVAADQQDVADNDEFLEAIKGQLQPDEILVFTPQSEIKTLPKGSTPLDFAYLIHSEVGHRAVGAKVDGKLVPLRSELQSGSIIEIITRENQRPNREWLSIVKTASARTKIRAWLRAADRASALEQGKEIFEKTLRRLKIPLKSVNNAAITAHLEEFSCKKIEDFYVNIGYGHITPTKAVRPFLPEGMDPTELADEALEKRKTSQERKQGKKSHEMILVRGMSDLLVHLAQCCAPIYGDEIVGYITHGRGVTVHRKDCKSFRSQHTNSERCLAVDWDPEAEPQLFKVHLHLLTEERQGMLSAISKVFDEAGANVFSLQAQVDEAKNVGLFDVVIQVSNLNHYQKILNQLRGVKGFLNYKRVQ